MLNLLPAVFHRQRQINLSGPVAQGLEQATHNPSILFSGIIRRHPDQCLQGFSQFDVRLNHHEFARKLANSIRLQYQIVVNTI
jgi:hypothetical protein